MAEAVDLAMWSPGPVPCEATAAVDSRTSGAGHDNLEDIYADIDSLIDIDKDRALGTVIEEDDPLAEFEAWLASGAVEIVEKL